MPKNPYAEKTVLVTGGTGSFGNFVVRRLLELGARTVLQYLLSPVQKILHEAGRER